MSSHGCERSVPRRRERLERLMRTSLDPATPGPRGSERSGLHDALDTITLQGYLRVLAGLVAENHEPHGRQWTVATFLFGSMLLRCSL